MLSSVFFIDAMDFDIHLNGSDSFRSAGDFESHISIESSIPWNLRGTTISVFFFDQTIAIRRQVL
jgi:hypothetical protein